jgi:hypothetical protein
MFANDPQAPDIAAGKGSVYAWQDNPTWNGLRKSLSLWFGFFERPLEVGEANVYFDVDKTGIGMM